MQGKKAAEERAAKEVKDKVQQEAEAARNTSKIITGKRGHPKKIKQGM